MTNQRTSQAAFLTVAGRGNETRSNGSRGAVNREYDDGGSRGRLAPVPRLDVGSALPAKTGHAHRRGTMRSHPKRDAIKADG